MTTNAFPYQVPPEPNLWPSLLLAAAVHLVLLAGLWFGVHWQNAAPVAIEAEVWSIEPRTAAPVPQPRRVPVPKEVKEIAKPVEPPKPVEKPDIALEQEKKRKALEDKEKELAEKQKREADERKKELAAKEKFLQEMREQAAREKELDRLRAEAGTGGLGDAAQTQGSRGTAEYVSRVGAKIKSNTVFIVPEYLTGNPAVEYAVELLPDGNVQRVRKLKSSGVPGFDEAVLTAIEKSQPFPRDKGRVPSGFNVVHRPKDQ